MVLDLTAVIIALVLHLAMTATADTLPRYAIALSAYGVSKLTRDGELIGGLDVFHAVTHICGLWAAWGSCPWLP